jgi:T-complex protein 1 subunit alpha
MAVLATQAISNVVKSSFGPSGLDKMMVDDIGVRLAPLSFCHLYAITDSKQDVTVTNDGATILSLLDIEHPAGKILVDLAHQQDKEVCMDRTSSGLVCRIFNMTTRLGMELHQLF